MNQCIKIIKVNWNSKGTLYSNLGIIKILRSINTMMVKKKLNFCDERGFDDNQSVAIGLS